MLLATLAAGCALAAPARARAPLGLDDCGKTHRVYQCSGLVRTWDGVPLDTTVSLPSRSARRLPLVVEIHGFGNSKYEYLDPQSRAYTDNAFHWTRDGYAVLTYTARGLWGSCGTPESRAASPGACADGYIHLADDRYEVRDSQELIGRLVAEHYAAPRRIGVTGDSYGGGQSLALAALRDRTMRPDGRLVPWRTAGGRRLSIAAAAPVIPWSDLISAAAPNGRVSATGITSRRKATSPVGVEKQSFVNGIFAAAQFAAGPGQPVGEPFVPGRPMGYLAPPGSDPQADVSGWVARTDAGEPYTDPDARAIVRRLVRFHSPYYIHPSRRPPPLLLVSGLTDDLFPVDEVLRYANRTAKLYPRAPVSLLLGDLGHQRAANKPAERTRLIRAIHSWFDHYLKGANRAPRRGVTAFVPTCPRSKPSAGPFRARRFAGLSHGDVRRVARRPRTILSSGGDPAIGQAIDPVAGGGNGCVTTSADPEPGTARYRLRRARRKPFTAIGAPRVHARLRVEGVEANDAQIASRLWDVAPNGRQRLVARGLYRPDQGRNAWQLHPAAWRFRRGHLAELELLASDPPYARPSNGTFRIRVRRLGVRLPVR